MHNPHDFWRLIPSGMIPHPEINKPGYQIVSSQSIYTGKRQSPWKPRTTEARRDLQKLSTLSKLLRAMPDRVLTIPTHGDSTASLDNLIQCSTNHTVKNLFLTFKWSFLHFNQCSLLPAILLGTTKESGSTSFTSTPTRCLYSLINSPLKLIFMLFHRC